MLYSALGERGELCWRDGVVVATLAGKREFRRASQIPWKVLAPSMIGWGFLAVCFSESVIAFRSLPLSCCWKVFSQLSHLGHRIVLFLFLAVFVFASLVSAVWANPLFSCWVWASFLCSVGFSGVHHCRDILHGLDQEMSLSLAIQICAISLSAICRVDMGELQSEALPSSA